jgi:hypothetical protein
LPLVFERRGADYQHFRDAKMPCQHFCRGNGLYGLPSPISSPSSVRQTRTANSTASAALPTVNWFNPVTP